MFLEQLAERDSLDAADGAGVVEVELRAQLVAGHADLLGIHDDDVVAAVHVRGVLGLVLAAQAHGHVAREAPERLAAGVDYEPVATDRLRSGEYRAHHYRSQWGGGRKARKCTQSPLFLKGL